MQSKYKYIYGEMLCKPFKILIAGSNFLTAKKFIKSYTNTHRKYLYKYIYIHI